MSQRWTRALLRLYPSRIRRRYGDELLDLQDELRAEGELSRLRLLRDALVGAVLVRSARQRACIFGSAGLAVGLIAATVAVLAAGQLASGSPQSPKQIRAATIQRYSPQARPCLVGSGMSCSLRPCATFISQTQRQPIEADGTRGVDERKPRDAKAVCVGSSRRFQPHAVFVSNATPTAATGG